MWFGSVLQTLGRVCYSKIITFLLSEQSHTVLFHNVGLFLSSFMEHDLDQTYACMQNWHQPKHIIYDTTESYIILLNSPYSIFEHLLPQCTAHYQGYRSKTHTHAVWTHRHHERTRFVLRWYELVIAPVHWRSCPGSDSVSLQMSGASHHTLLMTVSALEDSVFTLRLKKS